MRKNGNDLEELKKNNRKIKQSVAKDVEMSDYDLNENFLTNSASSAHDLPRTMTVAGKE